MPYTYSAVVVRRALPAAAVVLLLAAGCTASQHTPQPGPTLSAIGGPGRCRLGPNTRPDPACTPGATNPAVTPATIGATICVKGWTATVRPPQSYTEPLKVRQIAAYGYADTRLGDYEEDHLVPLELGGAPSDPRNLWPEPHTAPGGRGSAAKDTVENALRAQVCAGTLTLAAAQARILADWGPRP